MSDQAIKIIITDDHSLFRSGVIKCLAGKPGIEIIGEAENGLHLLKLLEHVQPDIILMGITMPVMNGEKAMPIVRKKYPALKVIILTMHNDYNMICRMVELGANAYLTKETGAEEIYNAILACHKNWFYINHTVRRAFAYSLKDNNEANSSRS
jgi:DNA-binding NarL/FixJ family response regulator